MSSIFAKPCQFIAGAASIESLPPIGQPEIAFIGRSNAGKSSLINALIGQKSLVRTSKHPGHTQQLNFFLLGERLMLVDMPGYGFAKVSKQKKGEWDGLIRHYLCGRPTLRRACVLVDARRGVLPVDEEFMELLDEAAVSFQIVLTKADTLKPQELSNILQSVNKTIESHPAAHPLAVATSALTGLGMETLHEQLAPFAA
ncbi:MAG: YihA family ribosome biogenesis GTP-binding protein [Pseudomonadota bacterium]|nr:YihA family ribosome biogenesis GTP-binding protein [Pseudomonadota bacterium]